MQGSAAEELAFAPLTDRIIGADESKQLARRL
jgi:hypothetical protein